MHSHELCGRKRADHTDPMADREARGRYQEKCHRPASARFLVVNEAKRCGGRTWQRSQILDKPWQIEQTVVSSLGGCIQHEGNVVLHEAERPGVTRVRGHDSLQSLDRHAA